MSSIRVAHLSSLLTPSRQDQSSSQGKGQGKAAQNDAHDGASTQAAAPRSRAALLELLQGAEPLCKIGLHRRHIALCGPLASSPRCLGDAAIPTPACQTCMPETVDSHASHPHYGIPCPAGWIHAEKEVLLHLRVASRLCWGNVLPPVPHGQQIIQRIDRPIAGSGEKLAEDHLVWLQRRADLDLRADSIYVEEVIRSAVGWRPASNASMQKGKTVRVKPTALA